MEFDLSPLLKDNRLVVHCPDHEVAIAFVGYIRKMYPHRYFRGYPGESEYWNKHFENTCYLPRIPDGPSMQYSDLEYYRDHGYRIINVSELMLANDIGPISTGEVDIKSLLGME